MCLWGSICSHATTMRHTMGYSATHLLTRGNKYVIDDQRVATRASNERVHIDSVTKLAHNTVYVERVC